jgi:hypothetical protein
MSELRKLPFGFGIAACGQLSALSGIAAFFLFIIFPAPN